MACLWPERDTEHARKLLNQAVHVLRRALGEEAIRSAGDELRLEAGVLSCDVLAFEAALSAGELEQAVNLRTGPFLDGFFLPNAPEFEQWADAERNRLDRAYARALEELADQAMAAGDCTAAAEWWRKRAAQDPHDSRVALRLMQALDSSGNRAGALQHATIHGRLLQEEFALAPDPAVAALIERLRIAPVTERTGEIAGRRPAAESAQPPEVQGARRGRVGTRKETGQSPTPADWIANPSRPPEAPGTTSILTRRVPRLIRKWQLWGSAAALLGVVSVLGVLAWRPASDSADRFTASGADAHFPLASLAVLPLKNLSGDPAQEYFADGLTEELVTTLTKIEGLRVIAHRSILQFKHSQHSVPEIARLLTVNYLLDGSVLQDGDRVRITISLIDASSNTPLWGERLERNRRDILSLQREVALAISRQIEITLTPQDTARLAGVARVDPEAFDLYVRGTQARYRMSDEGLGAAAEYFTQAIGKDSAYAPAYSGLAWVHAFFGDQSRARYFAEKALRLDPELAEPYVALGLVRQFSDWDWAGAEDAFRQAIRLNPGYAEAHHELSMLLMRLQRFDEALHEAQRTLYLAPMSARFQVGLGEVYLYAERYAEAIAAIEEGLALDPTYLTAYFWLAMAYGGQGSYDAAMEAAAQLSGPGCSYGPPYLGYLYAVSGDRDKVLEILDVLKEASAQPHEESAGCAYVIAMVYAGLGERNEPLEWLERHASPGHWIWSYLAIDPAFRSLHAEPRFVAVLRKVGLRE